MREMKDSRISWINQIPENWNVEPIKYSYRLIAGATPESTNVDFWDGDIKWITPADFKTKDVFVMGGSRNLTIEGYKLKDINPAVQVCFQLEVLCFLSEHQSER